VYHFPAISVSSFYGNDLLENTKEEAHQIIYSTNQ
jgi:hypothetical protein